MSQLFVYLEPELNSLQWMSSEPGQPLYSGSFEELISSELALSASAVTLFWPGERALVLDVQLPSGQSSQIQRILPYSVEEHIAEDIEQCHLVLLDRPEKSRARVAVINKDLFEGVIRQFDEAGIKLLKLYIDGQCLTVSEERQAHVFIGEGGAVVNALGISYACQSANLPHLLAMSLEPDESGHYEVDLVLQAQEADESAMLITELENLPGTTVNQSITSQSWLGYLVEQHARGANLLVGPYARKKERTLVDQLMPLAAVVGVFLLVSTITAWVRTAQLNSEAEGYKQAHQSVYQEIFGTDKRYRAHRVKGEVEALINGEAVSEDGETNFLMMSVDLSKAMKQVPKVELKEMRYEDRTKELNLVFLADGNEELQTLYSQLQTMGYEVDRSAQQDRNSGKTRGNFRIKEAG